MGRKEKLNRDKKMCDACTLSGKAMFSNPVASATDCTGITQTIPIDDEAAESYTDIYDVPVTSLDGGEKRKKPR